MLKLHTIITSFLMVITLTTSIVGNAANNTDGAKLKTKGEQNQLADIQPDGRKKLKQKIKLEYTHPDFEKMLDDSQKEAIIKSLKKWKLDLPVNNVFTVTSIGNFKDPNNKVVYMWASTPNSNWDSSKTPTEEDFETGDPRFVRAEFNVLLNKASKKEWKATIEQDNELKTVLNNIPESEISTGEKNVMFGSNLTENKFTDKSEILIDSTTVTTAIESKKEETPDKKVGLLDILFSSPVVSAGPNDYSWPWANGTTKNVNVYNAPNIKWHYDGYDSLEVPALNNGTRALDIQMSGGESVLAPISGVSYKRCSDVNGSTMVIRPTEIPNGSAGGQGMRLLHLSSNPSTQSVSVTKGSQVGTIKQGLLPYNGQYLCGGGGDADHLHLKFLADNMVVDGQTITYGTNYNSFTSNIGATVTPPPAPTSSKFNIRRTGTNQCINSFQPANNKALDTWTCDTTDPEETWEQVPVTGGFMLRRKNTTGTGAYQKPTGYCIDSTNPVTDATINTYQCDGNDNAQRFQYDSSTKKFYRIGTGNNNQCVAKGNPGNGLLIKSYTCTAFNDNFKWDFVPV
jgi:hypothetical protein